MIMMEEGIHNCETSVLQDKPTNTMQTQKQYHKNQPNSTSKQYYHQKSQMKQGHYNSQQDE